MPKLKFNLSAWVWQLLLMSMLGFSGIIFLPILMSFVEPKLMAKVLVAQVYVYYLAVLVQFGFAFNGPAALARAADDLEGAQVWRRSVRVKFLLLIVPVALLFGVGFFVLAWGQWYLLVFGLLLAAFAANSNWLLQAQHNFAAGVGFAALGVVLSALTIWVSMNALANQGVCVVLVLVLPQFCLGAGSWWLVYKSYGASTGSAGVDSSWHDSMGVLRQDAPLVASQLLLLTSTTLGTVVVSQLADANTTAAYAVTEKLFNLAATVVVGLYMAIYPRLAAMFYENRGLYWLKIKWLLLVCVCGGGGLAAVLATAGPVLMGLYLPAQMVQLVHAVLWPFALWLGLCIGQHVLISYLVLAELHSMVLWVNGCVLAVTLLVGYALAIKNPVAWVYGMLTGQVVALVFLLMLHRRERALKQ